MKCRRAFWTAGKADALGFMAVFPRGLRGAYPALPGSLGWAGDPGAEEANRAFLVRLIEERAAHYAIDSRRSVLGGFANGAYLTARELADYPESPFTAFWRDAGGFSSDRSRVISRGHRAPVFIGVAKEDWTHYAPAARLREQLLRAGWEDGTNLRSLEHPGGHNLPGDGFEAMWAFLARPSS